MAASKREGHCCFLTGETKDPRTIYILSPSVLDDVDSLPGVSPCASS